MTGRQIHGGSSTFWAKFFEWRDDNGYGLNCVHRCPKSWGLSTTKKWLGPHPAGNSLHSATARAALKRMFGEQRYTLEQAKSICTVGTSWDPCKFAPAMRVRWRSSSRLFRAKFEKKAMSKWFGLRKICGKVELGSPFIVVWHQGIDFVMIWYGRLYFCKHVFGPKVPRMIVDIEQNMIYRNIVIVESSINGSWKDCQVVLCPTTTSAPPLSRQSHIITLCAWCQIRTPLSFPFRICSVGSSSSTCFFWKLIPFKFACVNRYYKYGGCR